MAEAAVGAAAEAATAERIRLEGGAADSDEDSVGRLAARTRNLSTYDGQPEPAAASRARMEAAEPTPGEAAAAAAKVND